jgi:hypothetical protein
MAHRAMSAGAIVWLVIGSAWVLWLALSSWRRELPGPVALIRWFAQSWLGRGLALCAWGGAGWHLFCQRP